MSTRDFSASGEVPVPERRIDNDAPGRMRVELLNAIFGLADDTGLGPTERTLYNAVTGCLGVIAGVNPYGTLCRRASEHLRDADWPRVYDVILRLVTEFERSRRLGEYRRAVNRILSAYGIVWDVDETGRLVRVLPAIAEEQVTTAIPALSDPQFESARNLLHAAQDAFNAVPRRERDTCANVFDAMEAVGRIRFGGQTFGRGLDNLQPSGAVDRFVLAALRSLETIRHNHFGHGTQQPFNLAPAEVDFIYLTCIAGILLLLRLQEH
jgi:hypothetical protein